MSLSNHGLSILDILVINYPSGRKLREAWVKEEAYPWNLGTRWTHLQRQGVCLVILSKLLRVLHGLRREEEHRWACVSPLPSWVTVIAVEVFQHRPSKHANKWWEDTRRGATNPYGLRKIVPCVTWDLRCGMRRLVCVYLLCAFVNRHSS